MDSVVSTSASGKNNPVYLDLLESRQVDRLLLSKVECIIGVYFNIICSFPLFKLEITLFIHIVCMPDCEISIFLQSKNPTSGVQLKPIHSRFSEHNYSTMTDEAIETAALI